MTLFTDVYRVLYVWNRTLTSGNSQVTLHSPLSLGGLMSMRVAASSTGMSTLSPILSEPRACGCVLNFIGSPSCVH